MFHFDGSYRRSPIQSLGGSSIETDRQSLIKKAQQERKKREECRKKEKSCLQITSFMRYFKFHNFAIVTHQKFNLLFYSAGVSINDSVSSEMRD